MKTTVIHSPSVISRQLRRFVRSLTMVEMMVSLFIFLGAATSILYGFTISRRAAESTILHSITTDVAQAFLEQVKMMDYLELRQDIENPTTTPLNTYRPVVSGLSATVTPFPLFIDRDTTVPVTLDIRPGAVESAFNMTVRPTLRNLGASGSNPLPAIEVTIHFSYTTNTRPGGDLVTGRRVQYVIPNLAGTI